VTAATNPLLSSHIIELGPLTDKQAQTDEVQPKGSPYDPTFNKPFWDFTNSVIDATDFDTNQVDLVWLGGAYRHAVEDREVIIHDISTTSIVSFLLVLLLVASAFKDLRALPILFLPLLLGAVLTWGFTALVIGEVNTFTSTFTAILFGLGVDFAIHIYSRYREEFTEIGDQREAMTIAFESAGPPCLTAAITSAGGFLALRFAGFVGFQQLGIVLAAGVLFCLGSVLLVLPLMIVWLDNKKSDESLLRPPFQAGVEVRYDAANWWLIGIASLALFSCTFIPKLSFEHDLSELCPNGLAYDELSEAERSVAKKAFQPLVVSVNSESELLTVHDHAKQIIENKTTPYI
jgi:predicted exporter